VPSDPYLVLGLTPAATLVQVREAYRRAAMKHHPDRIGGDLEKFQAAKAAYELIESGRFIAHPLATPAGDVSAMTLDYINLRNAYPDEDGVCSLCDGRGKVNVAVGKIAWRSMPCPKCGEDKKESK